MPTIICTSPPNTSASGKTTANPPGGNNPALTRLNETVVSPKAAKPSPDGTACMAGDADNIDPHYTVGATSKACYRERVVILQGKNTLRACQQSATIKY